MRQNVQRHWTNRLVTLTGFVDQKGFLQVLVTVGRIGRAHGIKGEVGIDVRTDEPDRGCGDGAAGGREARGARRLPGAGSRWHSGRLLVKFAEVPDRTAAE